MENLGKQDRKCHNYRRNRKKWVSRTENVITIDGIGKKAFLELLLRELKIQEHF